MLEENIIFRRATLASVITSTYPMIVVGCYFGITPWNMERLSIDESDLSYAILLFGIFFIISNQIAGRLLVPRYGTKLVMTLAFPIVTFSALLTVISSSYETVDFEPPPHDVTDTARVAVANPAKIRLEILMNSFKLGN